MSEISSIQTKFSPETIEGFIPKTLHNIVPNAARQTSQRLENNSYLDGEVDLQRAEVNLNNYYANTNFGSWIVRAGQSFAASAERLDNAMVQAIQNGSSIQDVCNIRVADLAYKASARAFEAAKEMSTFALDV